MAENEVADRVVEVRAEFLSSLTNPGQSVIFRLGHFLTPYFPLLETPLPKLPPHAFAPNKNIFNVHVEFIGWQQPHAEWGQWVDRMVPIHQETWKKVGILEPIQTTKYKIHKSEDIIFCLAQKWHHETNSFIFPWGEASITLEDVYVMGGLPVTGDSVPISIPPDSDMAQIEKKLFEARKEINKLPSKKVTYTHWVKFFTDHKNGFGDIEHEAFLVFWLSIFVFPRVKDTVGKHVHAAAIHLSRGTRIALAPAVLASLYSDLKKIKDLISRSCPDVVSGLESIDSRSLMHLVQTWTWERFPRLGPNPIQMKVGDSRLARWQGLKAKKIESVERHLDEAGEEFQWRPYCTFANDMVKEFYGTGNRWVEVEVGMGYIWDAFAMFIRHSELVGLDGSIEQYLPHRVAMQFGMDQDIPGLVPRSNQTVEIAWRHYQRAFQETKLDMPPCISESKVTVRYSSWWKDLKEDKMCISDILRANKKRQGVGEGSGEER